MHAHARACLSVSVRVCYATMIAPCNLVSKHCAPTTRVLLEKKSDGVSDQDLVTGIHRYFCWSNASGYTAHHAIAIALVEEETVGTRQSVGGSVMGTGSQRGVMRR